MLLRRDGSSRLPVLGIWGLAVLGFVIPWLLAHTAGAILAAWVLVSVPIGITIGHCVLDQHE